MSILSEQSVKQSGSDAAEDLSQHQPSQKIAACTSSPEVARYIATESTENTPVEMSAELQTLCLHPSLHEGDLSAAAALITQSVSDILQVSRVSFWIYAAKETSAKEPEHQLILIDSFDRECNQHTSNQTLHAADFAPYFETLQSRSGLRVESADDLDLPISCLAKADLIFHEPGALLEVPVRVQGEVAGVIWCERASAYRWSALENAMAVSVSFLAATALSTHQQKEISTELQAHRLQLKRETIEREQAEQAWQESQRFIQGIIDASTNILYVDSFADGSNFYINRWIENVLGYTPFDLQKLGARYLEKLVHADDKATMVRERRKLLASNDGEVVENEYRFRHRQGNWRWLLCRETVFQRDKEGQPTQVFGTATDITKHKHAEVALKEFNAELARLARMDGLTQVANRRSFDEYLSQEWENVGSGRSSLSLILCDIDYFKNFNDTYGHQAGDVCLRRVAKAIEQAVKRSTDLVARYGGEEFAIILPNTNEIGVQQVAKEIQKAIKALNIQHSQSEVSDCITLSLGIASICSTENIEQDMLVASADQGLYQAKYDGRDRFCIGEIEYPQSSL